MLNKVLTPIKNFFCIVTFRPYRYVNIDIDPQIKTELEAIAREKGMTLNDIIVLALTEAAEAGEELIAMTTFQDNVEAEEEKPIKKSPSKKKTRKGK